MKRYKYNEWDFEWEDENHPGGFDERIYVDLDGNRITGILEGFYGYTADTSDERNSQYVENGKRKNMIYYKIVEKDSRGNYKTLFHGVNKSRIMPVGEWIKAEKKWVSDGGTKYWSGWHVMKTYEECSEYLKRFTAPRELAIVPCHIKGEVREKEHSPANIYLAEYIKII